MTGKEGFKMTGINAIVDSRKTAIRNGLIDFLQPRTMREVKGRLTNSEIQINDRLRGVVRRIIGEDVIYLRDDTTSRYNLMMSGIGDYMTDLDLVTKWCDDHYDNRTGSNVVAGYLFKKREAKSNK